MLPRRCYSEYAFRETKVLKRFQSFLLFLLSSNASNASYSILQRNSSYTIDVPGQSFSMRSWSIDWLIFQA